MILFVTANGNSFNQDHQLMAIKVPTDVLICITVLYGSLWLARLLLHYYLTRRPLTLMRGYSSYLADQWAPIMYFYFYRYIHLEVEGFWSLHVFAMFLPRPQELQLNEYMILYDSIPTEIIAIPKLLLAPVGVTW